MAIAYDFGWSAATYRQKAEGYAAEYADKAKERIEQICAGLEQAPMTDCIRGIVEATHEQQRSERDLEAQRNMADWAFWAMVVAAFSFAATGAGVLLIWRTLEYTKLTLSEAKDTTKAARETIDATREIGEAQTRAYLTCMGATFLVDKDGLALWLNLKNTGQSPTRQIMIEEGYVRAWGQGLRIETHESSRATGHGQPIAGGQEGSAHVAFSLDPELSKWIFEDGKDFLISCTLVWKDVFQKEQAFLLNLHREEITEIQESPKHRWRDGKMWAHHKLPLTPEEIAEDDAVLAEITKAEEQAEKG